MKKLLLSMLLMSGMAFGQTSPTLTYDGDTYIVVASERVDAHSYALGRNSLRNLPPDERRLWVNGFNLSGTDWEKRCGSTLHFARRSATANGERLWQGFLNGRHFGFGGGEELPETIITCD